MKILVAEDDKHLSDFLKNSLREEGFAVEVTADGYEARDKALSDSWDLLILDVMLPGLTGIQICELLRFKQIKTPILMLSALSETEDKTKALDTGADDYMTKPFHFQELLARIKALNRRHLLYQDEQAPLLGCADLTLDFSKNEVLRSGKEIRLSSKEFHLLKLLLEEKERVVSRTEILRKVWNTSQDTYTNVVDVYISYLRRKVDDGFKPKLIRTVKGRGYMIAEP